MILLVIATTAASCLRSDIVFIRTVDTTLEYQLSVDFLPCETVYGKGEEQTYKLQQSPQAVETVEWLQKTGLTETGNLQSIEVVVAGHNSRRIQSILPHIGENGDEGGTVLLERLRRLHLIDQLGKPVVQQLLSLRNIPTDAVLQRQTFVVICP